MTFALDRKMLLKVALILGLAALLVASIAVSTARVLANVNRMPEQVDKVLTAGLLHDHLVQESYAIKGYMLYGSADYLAAFRQRNGANRREIEELLAVVRPARKPLVREILDKHDAYTEACESKIIPLVAAGDTAGAAKAARDTGAARLIQEMLDLTSRLQEMRLADTRALLARTQERTVQALVFGCGVGLAVLAAVFGASSLALGRTALENMTYRLVLRRAQTGIVVVRRDGRVHFINRAAVSLLGIDRESAVGRPWAGLLTDRLYVVNAGGEINPP
ncbi:MAG: Diguanylate cyclase and metal dependent phosphohydrolase, partial [Clostridia bacterium 62_21]